MHFACTTSSLVVLYNLMVVLYNLMVHCCRLAGERTDVWIMRHADTADMNLWGLTQMDPELVSRGSPGGTSPQSG